jgi:Fe-S-cluster containining protein
LLKTEAEEISTITSKPIREFAAKAGRHQPYSYEMKKTLEGKCLFLYDKTCLIYPSRPLTCRFYPFQLHTIDRGESVFSYTEECPSLGKGKTLTEKDFNHLLQEAKDKLEANRAKPF